MSSTNPQEMTELLARGEQFTRIFVQPMVEAVRAEMKVHVDDVKKAIEVVNGFNGRVEKLETNQKRALWGWGVFASGLAAVGVAFYGWIRSHIKIG